MGEKTGIGWTQRTWNPWRGCHKVSEGCKHCYMFADQRRFGLDPTVVTRTTTFCDPLKWQRAAQAAGRTELVFTCSWSDWFIEEADGWRPEAWRIVRRCPSLVFQILTKRPERIERHLPPDWGQGYPHVWLGVSVENGRHLDCVDLLRRVPARIRFISAEPLLGSLRGLDLDGIGWLIAGGESGDKRRPLDKEHIRELRDLCGERGVPFFYKQGAALRPGQDRMLDGRTWDEYPLVDD